MLSSYYTLSHVASTLDKQLSGREIRSAFTQEKGQLILEVAGDLFIVLSCLPGLNALYLHRRFTRAKKNTADLLTACTGKTIESVAIHPSDRVVMFQLGGGNRLNATFFGSSANVTLVAPDGEVIDSFRRRKDPDERAGQRSGPPAKRNESVAAVLKQTFPRLGAELVREVLFRISISGTDRWPELSREQTELVEATVKDILNDLHNVRPRIYTEPDGAHVLSLIPLRQYDGCAEERFEDINDAIRMFIGKRHSTRKREDRRDALERRIATLLDKAERTAVAMEQDIASSGRHEDYERYGKLLLSNIAGMHKGMEEVSVDDGGARISIKLERTLTPAANAQRFFDKAKRSRTAQKEAGERLVSVRERIASLSTLQSALTSCENIDEFLSGHADKLHEFGLSDKKAAAAAPPFRVYHVDGGFEVWAGKNSKSNDELTIKHARPNDLWFHARGAGGSHVVLRVNSAKGEPGKKARLQAAGIAAWFSKHKGAKMVPVAMTQRKYVRKPKGAPPGTVAIEREEVIITAPALPEGKPLRDKSEARISKS